MKNQSNELPKYQQLIDEAFFDEAFQFLVKEVAKIEDVIEQKRVIRMALSYPLQESKIIDLASKNQLKELSIYKTTIEKITHSNNVEALHFMCANFENIHYESGELLARASDMKFE